jgi:hypothetical protein
VEHKKVLLSILLVALLVMSFSAASAQEETSTVALCTAADLPGAATVLGEIAPQMADAANASPGAADAGQLATSLAAWGSVYVNYFSDVYPNFPNCADSVFLSDTLALLISSQNAVLSSALLNTAQTDAGDKDADTEAALAAFVGAKTPELQNIGSSFQGIAAQIQAGTPLPSWLPACTEDQAQFTTELDAIEATFAEQTEALQAYLDEGTVDQESYQALLGVSAQLSGALTGGNGGCNELYRRIIDDVLWYNDTITLLNVGQALPYLQESESVEGLTALHDALASWLNAYLNPEPVEE